MIRGHFNTGRVRTATAALAIAFICLPASAWMGPQHAAAPEGPHRTLPKNAPATRTLPSGPVQSSSQYPQLQNQGHIASPQPMNRAGHLADWLSRHQNLSAQEQKRALQQEPGFHGLAPEVQQRLLQRLDQLNNMPPEQRQRNLARMEAMERLSKEQKEQVRNSAATLKNLPSDRQRLVSKAFRDLREIPPEQRQAVLNSSRFAGVFNPQERSILSNLLSVEPYQPRNYNGFAEGMTPAGK